MQAAGFTPWHSHPSLFCKFCLELGWQSRTNILDLGDILSLWLTSFASSLHAFSSPNEQLIPVVFSRVCLKRSTRMNLPLLPELFEGLACQFPWFRNEKWTSRFLHSRQTNITTVTKSRISYHRSETRYSLVSSNSGCMQISGVITL